MNPVYSSAQSVNPKQGKGPTTSPAARLATALIAAASLAIPAVQAASGTWNVDADGLWSSAGNWTPGIADGATFTANLTFNLATGRTVTLDSARSLGVLNIGDTNTTHSYTLATGANVLTFDNGASDAQLNQVSTSFGDTISGNLAIGGNGNLTVTNAASAKTLTISAGITSALSSGTQTLTFNNDNAVLVSGVIGNGGSGGTLALVKTGTGTTTLSNANTYTGGLAIKSGTVTGTNANAFGTNANVITLGDSSGGTANSTLSGGALTFLNPITVASSNTGTATITTSGAGTTVFNGAITLSNHNLTALGAFTALTLGGGISGTGDLLLNTASAGLITISGTVNNIGTITNIGGGATSNGTTFNATIGANVTGIIQNSPTAAITFYGNNVNYNGGITIKRGQLSGSAANALGAITSSVTIGDSVGSSSSTLGGSGSYANPINIASGNTGVATITNTFGNAVTFSGLVTLNGHDLTANILSGGGSNTLTLSGGIASTGTGGNLTLNAQGAHAITLSGATGVNNAGTITNSSTGTATNVISAIIGANVTGLIQNSGTSKLSLSGAQTYTAPTTVNAGTLTGTQNSGTPFGTGNIILNGGTLQLTPGTAASASVSGASALAGSTFTYAGGATLGLTKNGANNLSYTVGNASPSGSVLARNNTGTLVIAPTASANLGSSEKFVVNGLTSAANINGIYSASVVDQVGSGNTGVGSFVKYDTTATNGFLDAATGTSSYTTRSVGATLAANEISDVTTSLTAADTSNPYALRVGAVTLTNAGTTTVNGGSSGVANSGLGGIILNPTATASVISGGTLAFGASEGVVYVGSGAGGGSITSAITGTAGLTKFGPGVLTLNNAANTYTGTTTINSGTLAAGANDQIATGALTINGSTSVFSLGAFTDTVGTVTVANFGSITGAGTLTSTGTFEMQNGSVSAVLAGGGIALNKTTTGTVTLTGANTYTGATTVNAGTLQLNGANGATTGATAYVLNGGSLFLDNSANTNANRIANASTIALNGGAFSLRGPNNAALTETVGAISGTGNSTITLTYTGTGTNVVTLAAASFTHSAGNGTNLVSGNNLGLNSTGTNTITRLTLTTAPTLVGTTNALTTGINSAAQDTKIVPFLVGDVVPSSGGAATVSGTANTFLTYVAGSGLRPLNPANEFANNAIISGNNTYITSATAAAATSAINSLVIAGADLSINDGATLTNTSGALLFTTSNTIKPSGTTGIYTGGAEHQITVNTGVTGTINPVINGSQPLTKSGAGTLVLGGANTYTGATTVTAGALNIGSSGSLASGNALSIGASATANFANADQTLGAVTNTNTATNALNFSASTGTVTLASLSGAGNTRFGSAGTITGGISTGTVNAVGLLTSAISGGTVSAGSLTGAVSGGAVTVTGLTTGNVSGSGTLGAGSLSSSSVTGGTNTITGAAGITTLNGGATTVGGVATIGTLTSGTANLNGATSAITTFNGGTVNLGSTTALTVSNGSSAGTLSGGSGSSLIKTSGSSLTLSGTSTGFSGSTLVNGGLLTVNGSIANSAVTVNNTGTLGGGGTVGAVTINSGGTIAPGNSPGLLFTGSQTWTDGGNYNWQVANATGDAGTGFDSVSITGGLNLSGLTGSSKFNLNLWSLSGTGPDTNGDAGNFDNAINHSWTLVSTTTGVTGFVASYFQINTSANNGTSGFTNDLGGGSFGLAVVGNDLNLIFTAAAIPEPSTYAALAGALVLAGTLIRRRRRV